MIALNPHTINIFYCLIIPCGVRLSRSLTQIHYLHLQKWNHQWNRMFIFTCTWHIMNKNQMDVTPEHLTNFCVEWAKKLKSVGDKWVRSSTPMTSLNVTESQSWCLYPGFQGQGRKPVLTFILQSKKHLFKKYGRWAKSAGLTPTQIWLHSCHSCMESKNII